MNMGIQIHVKLPTCNFGGTYPKVELMDHSVITYFSEVLPFCFPQWLHHVTFPLETHRGSSVPTSWPIPVILCLFSFRYGGHLNRCKIHIALHNIAMNLGIRRAIVSFCLSALMLSRMIKPNKLCYFSHGAHQNGTTRSPASQNFMEPLRH